MICPVTKKFCWHATCRNTKCLRERDYGDPVVSVPTQSDTPKEEA